MEWNVICDVLWLCCGCGQLINNKMCRERIADERARIAAKRAKSKKHSGLY
jgi:hypothetical protein